MPAAGGGGCMGAIMAAVAAAAVGDAGKMSDATAVGDWFEDGSCESIVETPDWMGSLLSTGSTIFRLAAGTDDCASSDSASKSILLGDGIMGTAALGGKEAARRVFIVSTSNVKTDGPPDGDAAAAAGEEIEADEEAEGDLDARAAEEGEEGFAGELGNAREPN